MRNLSPMRRSKILVLAGMLALSVQGISQNPSVKVFEDWNTTAATQNSFQRTVVRSKAFGGAVYYYLCGATLNSNGNYDMLIQKKNSAGNVLWAHTYNGAGNGNDYATDVQVDAVGNVYICGTYYKDATDSNNAIVIKYNTVGTHKWTNTYNGAGSRHDAASALAVRGSEVYVVGTTWKGATPKYDMLAIRYDSTGSLIWTQNWDYSSLFDVATNVNFTSKGLVVAGGAQSAIATYKYATVRLAYSDGSVATFAVSSGTGFGFDQVTDLQTDVTGNVYITGGSFDITAGYNIRTVKMDTSLNILWQANYDGGSSLNDMGTGLQLDQLGNVIVTGYRTSSTTGQDYVTIKYSSGGVQRWVATYDGGINAQDSATSIVVSPTDTNKIYVTGSTYNGSSKDYMTMKYDGQGNRKWEINFNNVHNTDDRATAIALDTLGNVIVAGQNKLAWNSHTYTTVKYIEKSVLLPDDTIPHTSNSFIYTENRGQVLGTDTVTHSEIKYYVNSSPKMYFMDTAVSYVLSKLDTSTSSAHIDTLARVDMKFVNANSNLRIRPMDVREDYDNFYLGHIPDGRCLVQSYNQLVSFDVWNNVDMIYGSNLAGMKYYFICKPSGGSNAATQIHLKFNGADSVKINGSGQLVIYTPIGNIVQPKAAAWQLDATGNYQSLGWQPSYSIVGTNEVQFTSFGTLNTGLPLVLAIDWGNVTPTTNQDNLWWSTFYGQGGHDRFKDVKVWSTGEQSTCGNTQSLNFPTFAGYQMSSFGAMSTAIVVKFNPDNSRYWATCFGGFTTTASNGAYTQAESLDYDWGSPSGDLYFAGNTSTDNFPTQPWGGAYYQNTINDGCTTCPNSNDAFIAKLSANGLTLIWSTYYGGDDNEIIYEIKAGEYDPNDLYIGGSTSSANLPFPNTLPTWSDGTAFFARFDYLGVQQWGTYIGNATYAAGGDAVYSIATDIGGSVVLVGQVGAGSSFPVQLPASGNTGNSTHAAGSDGDAFMMKLDFNPTPSNPTIVWSMYYGGTMGELAFDVVTNVYSGNDKYWIVGNALKTSINNGAPNFFNPGNGAYFDNTHNGGSLDAWVMQMDLNGNIPWATFYGGNDFEYGRSVAVDLDENVYITGETKSNDLNTNGTFPSPNLTGGYVNTSQTGVYDLYLGAFVSGTHAPLWGTYYGGGTSEWTPAVACYYNQTLYLCGSEAGSGVFPLYSGPGCVGTGTPYTDFAFSSFGSWKASIAGFCLDPIFPGVVEDNSTLGVNVFPNPTGGIVTIAGQLTEAQDVTIEVFDVLGQLVYQETIASVTSINSQIDLSLYGNGIYLVNVRAGENFTTEKVILQR